jgi:sigma-B regulation protein RsbU (phosphoserine phosphatase)
MLTPIEDNIDHQLILFLDYTSIAQPPLSVYKSEKNNKNILIGDKLGYKIKTFKVLAQVVVMKIGTRIFASFLTIALATFALCKFTALATAHFSLLSTTTSIGLTIAIAYFLSRIVVKPLQELTELTNASLDSCQEVAALKFSKELATFSIKYQDEVGELAHAFQRMEGELDRSRQRLEQTIDLKNRLESELIIGREIQMNMLTLTFPSFPKRKDLNIHAILQPARELGGDFYDFYFLDGNLSYLFEDNRFCFSIGDVSGKGVPAALFMAVIKILIKSQASKDPSPANILTKVNQKVSADNPSCMFVTLFFAVLDLKNGELVYTNAGHNPPYIRRRDGSLEQLNDRHGPALGVLEDRVYKESRVTLKPGDILFTYTDGVTEALDSIGNLFSEQRLAELLAVNEFSSAEEVIRSATEAVLTFQGNAEQADDITMLSLQFLGHPETSKGDLSELFIKKEVLSRLRGLT